MGLLQLPLINSVLIFCRVAESMNSMIGHVSFVMGIRISNLHKKKVFPVVQLSA